MHLIVGLCVIVEAKINGAIGTFTVGYLLSAALTVDIVSASHVIILIFDPLTNNFD